MHNNFHFIKYISHQLGLKLTGFRLEECFSQNRDELLLGFDVQGDDFYIKANLVSTFCCLSFPDNFHRSRKNSADIFKPLVGKTCTGVRQYLNERCFSIIFEKGYTLLFKMHGNRANLILYQNGEFQSMFKNNLGKDGSITLSELDRPINQSYDAFKEHDGDYKLLFPTYGKAITQYLGNLHYDQLGIEKKWAIIEQVNRQLEGGVFYITTYNGLVQFSLIKPDGDTLIQKFTDPIVALNNFYLLYIKEWSLNKEKKGILGTLQRSLTQSMNYIKKTRSKLESIQKNTGYDTLANIVMANLHQIPPMSEKVELDNFYDNTKITIKLKKNLSPQKNAELFYKKSKNQKIEIDNLTEALTNKQFQVEELKGKIDFVTQCQDLKPLRNWCKENNVNAKKQVQEIVKPYYSFQYQGFNIWVGKNAKSNDELTLKHTWKEDLWLHAKDVSGSHVVIKQQSGKHMPKDVIEKAAQLAAYYSKRKNDTLCPVAYTPKKFVRKRKGDPAGAVVVEKESVILVEPKKW